MTWNPIRARTGEVDHRTGSSLRTGTFCTRISPGCTNCYASAINKRFGTGAEYTVPNLANHEFYIDERILEEPLKRKKPATIFVGDMFDLFHEAIPFDFIKQVFHVAYCAPWHTFQMLTKRAQRMLTFFTWCYGKDLPSYASNPIGNIWLGVSVESQKYADERIPWLLQTPAAVRFLSVEPLLEAVTLTNWLGNPECPMLDWVIVGGESGPGARQFAPYWAGKLLGQCRIVGTKFFMKQFGSNCYFRHFSAPHDNTKYSLDTPLLRDRAAIALEKEFNNWSRIKFKDRKGGDPSEWPEEVRVREFPA
jgi:protein gp37